MKSYIPYIKYLFLGLLLIGSTSVTAYEFLYNKPKKKCEAAASWWSEKDWKCYAPVSITTFTGRNADQPQATPSSASQ